MGGGGGGLGVFFWGGGFRKVFGGGGFGGFFGGVLGDFLREVLGGFPGFWRFGHFFCGFFPFFSNWGFSGI